MIVPSGSSSPRVRTTAVTAAAPAAATMRIHFFDLPVFCGAAAGRVVGAGRARACSCCGSAVATITGRFGRVFATTRSATFCSDFGVSSPLLAKAAVSTMAVIIDITTRTISDGIYFGLSFVCGLGFIWISSLDLDLKFAFSRQCERLRVGLSLAVFQGDGNGAFDGACNIQGEPKQSQSAGRGVAVEPLVKQRRDIESQSLARGRAACCRSTAKADLGTRAER